MGIVFLIETNVQFYDTTVSLVVSMLLPVQSRVSGDVNAVQLVVRMKRAYVRPHMRALSQTVLAVRALEPLRYAALVFVMPYHVTAMLVAAIALRTGMPISPLIVADAMVALQRPLQERIWKKRVRIG